MRKGAKPAGVCGLVALVLGVLSLGFAPGARAAETGAIAGTVYGQTSQEPVEGIEVTVYGAEGEQAGSAATNANGEYVVSGLPFGEYEIELSRGASTLDYVTVFWPSGYSSSEGQRVKVVSPDTSDIGATFLPLAEAPASVSPPTISGEPAVGQTLTCSIGLFEGVPPPVFGYQWLRDGLAIAGATASDYTVQSADQGDGLACEVTATNGAGQRMATSASVAIPPAILPGGGSTGGSGTVDFGPAPSGAPFFKEPPQSRYPPEPRYYSSRRRRGSPSADVGLYVTFCPAQGHLARAHAGAVRGSAAEGSMRESAATGPARGSTGAASVRARAAGTSEKGWPPDQCLKMDKGPAGRRHTLVGVLGVHNWLLGGYGNDTIVGANKGDVIWADYHPNGEPRWQSATIRAGNGRNVIYANDSVNYVWTGTNPRTVVHAHDIGTSGVIHCQSPGIVVFLSNVSERHFKLDGCDRISHYSVGY